MAFYCNAMNISITIPDEDVERFAQLAEGLSNRVQGLTVTRAEAIRFCAQRGLQLFENEVRAAQTVTTEEK